MQIQLIRSAMLRICIRQPFVEQGHGRLMMSITPIFEFMEPLGGAQICSGFS